MSEKAEAGVKVISDDADDDEILGTPGYGTIDKPHFLASGVQFTIFRSVNGRSRRQNFLVCRR